MKREFRFTEANPLIQCLEENKEREKDDYDSKKKL